MGLVISQIAINVLNGYVAHVSQSFVLAIIATAITVFVFYKTV